MSANHIVVLQAADPLPERSVALNTVELGSNDNTLSYRDMLQSARMLALKSGANVIKVAERTSRTASNAAERLRVTFYKSENPYSYEKEFGWDENRKLSWGDFRGPMQPQMGEDVAAATFCGIGFETNTISAHNPSLKVHVYNTFYATKSWVKTGLERPEILSHEQCHFDICELYTRKLRERMSSADVTVATMKTKLKNIYTELQKEYVTRQELYEAETEHGIIPEEQAKWERMIAAELSASEKWKE